MRHCSKFCISLILLLVVLVGSSHATPPQPIIVDSPIIEAARTGDIAAIERALALGAPIDKRGVAGRAPLHIASEWGQLAAVEFLLKTGARFNIRAKDRATPLQLAILNNHADIVATLLEAGADPNQAGASRQVPLILATRRGLLAHVRLLLAAGADRDATDQTGRTAHDWAAHKRIPLLLQILNTPTPTPISR